MDRSPHILLKRLSPIELTWFRALRASPVQSPRGPRLERDDVEAVFGLADGVDCVAVRTRWHDGRRVIEDLRPLERHGDSWWLGGETLHGDRLARAREGDVAVVMAEGIEDVVGKRGWLLTIDAFLDRESKGEDVRSLLRDALGDRTSARLDGEVAERALIVARQCLPAFGGGKAWDIEGLTDRDWAAVRAWLVRWVRMPQLRALLEHTAGEQVHVVLELLGRDEQRPKRRDLAEAVIRRYGTDLLADPHRRDLLIRERFRANVGDPPVLEAWTRGGPGAHRLAHQLGLPAVMAGHPVAATPDFEDLGAFPPLGPLHDYQKQIADGIRSALHSRDWHKRRAVVWMPTGTGKTRVCVETLLMEAFLAPPRNCLLWVADREELCEQAIETFRHVWMVNGYRTPSARGVLAPTFRVVRLWGGRPWQELPSFPTLVVASIQTLARRIERPEMAERIAELGDRCAAVVFDEAHHVVAPSYARVIRALGLSRKKNVLGRTMVSGPPLIGLTATPARRIQDETELLAKRFHGRLLEPDEPYRSMRGFVRGGYVARPKLEVVPTGYVLDQLTDETEVWTRYRTLPKSALRRTGRDPMRTAAIVSHLEKRLPDLDSVLVFACSVDHAETLAEVLSRRGHRAVALHGGSPHALRQSAIRRFREKSLKVLVSCDLLTTGFDAPNVEAVVLARPVESRVLFAQMVGRGLRGPRNGGTAECLILDYEDNIGAYQDLDALRVAFRNAFVEGAAWDDARGAPDLDADTAPELPPPSPAPPESESMRETG